LAEASRARQDWGSSLDVDHEELLMVVDVAPGPGCRFGARHAPRHGGEPHRPARAGDGPHRRPQVDGRTGRDLMPSVPARSPAHSAQVGHLAQGRAGDRPLRARRSRAVLESLVAGARQRAQRGSQVIAVDRCRQDTQHVGVWSATSRLPVAAPVTTSRHPHPERTELTQWIHRATVQRAAQCQ
jgi:hypothetical protein